MPATAPRTASQAEMHRLFVEGGLSEGSDESPTAESPALDTPRMEALFAADTAEARDAARRRSPLGTGSGNGWRFNLLPCAAAPSAPEAAVAASAVTQTQTQTQGYTSTEEDSPLSVTLSPTLPFDDDGMDEDADEDAGDYSARERAFLFGGSPSPSPRSPRRLAADAALEAAAEQRWRAWALREVEAREQQLAERYDRRLADTLAELAAIGEARLAHYEQQRVAGL